MKKIILALTAVVAIGVAVPVALAANAAPKTTGGIGYTAYSDVQRHLEFNAIQSKTDTCGTSWNVTGVSQFTFNLPNDPMDYTHHVALTQSGQDVGGEGGYPLLGGVDEYHWNVTDGSLVGNALELDALYDFGAPGTVMEIHGTIAPDGSISGTWSDDAFGNNREGTFTAPAGSATASATYCGKGNVNYSDASGNWYSVDVKAVNVDGDDAWFAGPVTAGNVGAGQWLFVKVYDGGEPGKLVDEASGSFTDEITAINGVIGKLDPADGPFTITSGNLQVH